MTQIGSGTSAVWRVFLAQADATKGVTFVPWHHDPFGGAFNSLLQMNYAPMDKKFFLGDYNNDGIVDLGAPDSVRLGLATYHDILSSVTDGFGRQTGFQYSTLDTQERGGKRFYTPGAAATFPISPASRGMKVVQSVATSDGMGGVNRVHFYYTGAKTHLQGRGFLGFEKIEARDESRGLTEVTEYRQDYPYVGRIKRHKLLDKDGQLASITDNAYALQTDNSRFPYLKTSIKRQYGLLEADAGYDIGASKTTFVYDRYGNLTTEETISGYGYANDQVTTPLARSKRVDAFTNNTTDYLLGFRNRSELSTWTYSNGSLDSTSLKQSVTTFEPEPGRLDTKVTRHLLGTSLERTDTVNRNAQGVITSTHTVGKDIDNTQTAARQATFSNFISTIYPQTLRNSLGHQITLAYDTRFGAVKRTTDANGLIDTAEYDPLGRLTRQVAADGTVTELKSFYCVTAPLDCPQYAVYASATVVTHPNAVNTFGAPIHVQYFDALQRVIREEVHNVNGDVVKVDHEYYPDGRLHRVSEPFTGWSADYWTIHEGYDALGRPSTVTAPDGGMVEVAYARDTSGELRTTRTTTVVGPSGYSEQIATTWTNALGQMTQTQDDLGTPVRYTYDSRGNLAATLVNNDSRTQVTVTSDLAGNKSKLVDPAAGTIGYEFNAFGELRRQTWAPGTSNAKSITYVYDTLGRQTGRTDKPVSGSAISYSWLWDTVKIGLLTHSTGNGYQEIYGYDSQTRINRIDTKIDGITWVTNQTYDVYSRLTTTTYPNGFKAERRYHAAGWHTQTYNVTTSTAKLLWEQQYDSDERGNLTGQKFGNGLLTQNAFDEASGRLREIVTGKLSSTNTANRLFGDIQNLSFEFDSLGNLAERRSERTNISGSPQESLVEELHYDSLNRLEVSITTGLSLTARRVDYDYDVLGNLTSRSDKGTLQYSRTHNASIYGITSGAGKTYKYDVYGNVTSRGTDAVTYDVFNKPTQIGSTTFAYGPEHQRFKQVNGSKVTYYIGGDFEEVRDGTQTTQKAYIDGIALYSKTGTTGKLQYLHYDHLGSVETITDEAGAIVSRMSFNPWGERQQADWKTGTPSNLNTLPTTSSFTGHEHLDQLGLIHMGGRVYDPQVGRFLSADLFVQAPHFSQSFNRYSYVFNNPLSYTDPSGYQTTGCQATACEEVNTFGYSDSGDSGGWMRSGSWNYHGMAEFDFGLTHVWGQTLIKSQENPLVLDFSQNTDQSMAVTMGMMEAAEAKEYKKLLREGMQSSMNGAGLSLAGRGGRMNDARRGKLSDTGYDVAFVGYLLIGFDVANTITGIGAGPDTGILGMAMLASRAGAAKGVTPKNVQQFESKRAAFRAAKRDAGIPTSQTHTTHTKNLKADGLDTRRTATEYVFGGGKKVQDHPAGHKFPDGGVYNKSHFNNHGTGGTKGHYEY